MAMIPVVIPIEHIEFAIRNRHKLSGPVAITGVEFDGFGDEIVLDVEIDDTEFLSENDAIFAMDQMMDEDFIEDIL